MALEKPRKHRFPILGKTAIIIVVMALIIVEVAMTYFSLVISNRNKQTYGNVANDLSATIAEVIDPEDYTLLQTKVKSILDSIDPEDRIDSECEDEALLEEYIANYDVLYDDDEFVETFDRVRGVLRRIVSVNQDFDIDCAYLAYIYKYTDEQGNKQGLFVYLCDSAPDEDACPPGWLDPLYDMNREVLDDQERGFPAYETDTTYGYLVTAGTYIKGTTMGFALLDINMDSIRKSQATSIVRLFIYLASTIVLLAIICLILIYFIFSRPLKRLTSTAKAFDKDDPKSTHQKFVDLKVNTHDEIQELTESIKFMEESVVERINELVEVNNALTNSEEQKEKMTVLAKVDSMTGVYNKRAYFEMEERLNQEISKGHAAFSITMIDLNDLKITNDTLGHEKGDALIVKVVEVIKNTFVHSNVYRVGGDEFVVLSEGTDYKNIKKLEKEFKEFSKDISAAIGVAIYDSKIDNNVEDTFKRADRKMYENKKEMKGLK